MAEHPKDPAMPMPTSMHTEEPNNTEDTNETETTNDAAQVQPPLEVAPSSTGRKRSFEHVSEDDHALDQAEARPSSSHASPAQKKTRRSDAEIVEPAEHQAEDVVLASLDSPDPESTETSNLDMGASDDDNDEVKEVDDGVEVDKPTTQGGNGEATAPLDWNSASHKVVRTSFGAALPTIKTRKRSVMNTSTASSAGPASPKDAEATAADTQAEAAAPNDKSGIDSAPNSSEAVTAAKSRSASGSRSRSASKADDSSTMRRKSVDWSLPDLPMDATGGRKKQFLAWCQEFCTNNMANIEKVDARLLRRGYLVRLEYASITEQVRKECKKGARNTESTQVGKILSNFTKNDKESSELSEGEIVSDPEPAEGAREGPPPTVTEKQAQQPPGAGGSGKVQLSRDEELQQLRLYFPGASETSFCVICARDGHRANDCPSPTCRHCRTQDHSSNRCPTRVRCTKCRRLGHVKKSCPEKLAVAPGEEQMECAVCCAVDHLEESCESLWRTYHPDPDNTVKVQSIPAFCYSCGADNHFGGDCGLYKLASSSKDETWTVANRDRYVDPESDVLPVSWVPPPPPDPERPSFGGRSIAPQRNHVYFESDDDDEGEFIQPLVRNRGAPPPPRQQIRINSQAGAPPANGTAAGRQRESSRSQRRNEAGRGGRNPPLPPGPPPSLPARPPGGMSGGGSSRGGGRRGRGGFSRVRGGNR